MNIVLSDKVKNPNDLYDVVVANCEFIKKALDNNVIDSDLNEDAIALYYLDYFDEIVAFNGFKAFFFKTRNSEYIKEQVKKGLNLLKLDDHLKIFEDYEKLIEPINKMNIYQIEGNMKIDFSSVDEAYRDLVEEEIENKAGQYLLDYPNVVFASEPEQDKIIEDILKSISVDEMIKRENEVLSKIPSYLRDIQLICNENNLEMESLTKAELLMFDYDPRVVVFFKTTNGQDFTYIDLGLEVVLAKEDLSEIKRYLKAKLGELNG